MEESLQKILKGYKAFRKKYALGDNSIMKGLHDFGQNPHIMVVSCCDSRVDPALILQCDPGDLFIVRNVASIVPPYEKDDLHHGTSAALEFGVCFLNVKHLIILGHSQCGGMGALFHQATFKKNDFISNWMRNIKIHPHDFQNADDYAKAALFESYKNAMMFPWIAQKVIDNLLKVHMWFFDVKHGEIWTFDGKMYYPLEPDQTAIR